MKLPSLEKYFVKATYSVIQINPQISHNFCNKNYEGKFLQFLHCVWMLSHLSQKQRRRPRICFANKILVALRLKIQDEEAVED